MSRTTEIREFLPLARESGDLDLFDPRSMRADVGPERAWYPPMKVALEWLLALCLMAIAAPLMLFLGGLVKLTSAGPAFYAQTRLGLHGRTFRMLKLRTMAKNAEAGTGPVWARVNDSRVTPLGRILRLTHLDELPQLWNVLRGEMSLIGPRPERPELACRIERKVPGFHQRLLIRPGITGLAQMLLAADNPDDEEMICVRQKLSHDLCYIRKMSAMLDLRIAICTPCYFIAAAIKSLGTGLLKGYGKVAEKQFSTQSSEQGRSLA